ncbi:Na+/H+ antiporter [Emiliania huxleyi CCMP1516]|uniref:Na+/H+ antiporter n=2 Tax=Emiliania huxleyi TaxID=2903 RepID=A0A0D3JGZ3_EMIH1|nr:Na+/H+ antiporter [Emiliania huxleyi CCMP1516]EOD22778.1 Na+/H+ antiporter [Emiliania huxleyi CCMP1516]|eukprot:XP_005775207.1 Na+/H+ antiporter [Emiliania huxleyi CCMP1516]
MPSAPEVPGRKVSGTYDAKTSPASPPKVKRRDSSASMTDELFRISRQNSMTSVGGEDFADIEVAQTLGPRASPTPAFLPPDGRQLSRSVSRVQLKRWASDGWRKARSAGNYWLLFGIAAALLWINLDHESYEYFPAEPHYAPFGNKAVIFDHPALAPLIATVGGAKRDEKLGWPEVKNGWGVPTATDISLAWVIALAVFPKGHPAIEFLLLLAVADDAIGLGIIAIAYPDPHHPVQPQWMGLALMAAEDVPGAGAYLVLGGFPAWVALLKSALHPALQSTLCDAGVTCTLDSRRVSAAVRRRLGCFACLLCGDEDGDSSHDDELMGRHAHAPLHAFEHALKVAVERRGYPAFTLKALRPLTVGVFTALVAGKMLGITTLVCLASCLRIAPLAEGIIPRRMTLLDVVMVSAVASVGLTVALFVSGEAYQHEELQSESKLGALLSGLMGLVCYGISKMSCWPHNKKPSLAGMDASNTSQVGPANDGGAPDAGLSRKDSACSATAVVDGGLDERSLDGHDAAGIWGARGGHNSSCRSSNNGEGDKDRYSTPAAYAATAQQHAWLKQGAPQRQRWHHS